ncbi:GGDEF domain-containing protein [Undibacterium parvum]|uniref:diguanylate cyclase n=1 Tax=Undibacterium parvum TaxID=401471 RepID=A0A3Q9BSD4_9BURK|nr:GGDEF domain-containing protein [Undibacterium parvum]AZP13435.1 GGDEF domain-containing protein [Undibacterium parvum]
MNLYALSDEISRLHPEASALVGAPQVEVLASLAWYLRQLDSQASLALIEEAEYLITSGSLPEDQSRVVRSRLLLTQAEIAALTRDFELAEQLLLAARAGFVLQADVTGEGDSYLVESVLALEQGDMKRALSASQSALSRFEQGCELLRILLAQAWHIYLLAFSEPERARKDLMLLVSTNELKHPALAALIAATQAELLFTTEVARSAVLYSQASELAQKAGLIRLAIMAACNAGVALQKLGDFDAAATSYDWAVTRARKTEWPLMIAFSLMRFGELLRHLNRLEQSQQVLEESLQGLIASNHGIHTAIAQAELGTTLLLRGLPKQAAAYFDTAIALYRAAGSRGNLAEHLISQARALSAAGEPMAALMAIDEARQLIIELSSDTLHIDLRVALAEIYARHELPYSFEIAAPNLVLHFLEEALIVGNGLQGWQAPATLLLSLAEAWSAVQQGKKAFEYAKKAIAADRRERNKQAENWATLMQVRHETERAKADAIHHQQMASASLETSQTLKLLAKVGQEITADLNFKNVCQSLQRHLGSLLGAADICIWLITAKSGELELSYCVEGGVAISPTLSPNENKLRNAVLCIGQRDELVCESDVSATSSQANLFGPLIIADRALGVIAIQSTNAGAYGERERLIFRSLCAYGAIALDNAYAHDQLQKTQDQLELALKELEETSLTDPLTGLKNRRFLIQNIENDVALCIRHYQLNPNDKNRIPKDADLLMFLVDLDHFKQINDKYGHAAGDAVLVQIRERLQQVFRDTDYLIRWGGEEFLIVARATSREIAADLAERVRLVVADKNFLLDGDLLIRQTCSVGYACFPFVTAHPRAVSWQEVIDIADIALYAVKHSGRNGWVGLSAEEHAWPELLLCTLKNDPKGAILNNELKLATNKTPQLVIDALTKKQSIN